MVLGFLIGVILVIIAGYVVKDVLFVGITMAAMLTLFPKMAGLVCEGIVPVTNTIMAFMKKRFKDRELNVAVDPTILLGDPSVMATFIIMIPISIILSFIIPSIGFIPIATPIQARHLRARFFEGKKFREIAEMEGVSPSQANRSISAAVKKLRKYFSKNNWKL